jgi:biotin carboxylase
MAPLPDANVVRFEVMTSRDVIYFMPARLAVMGFSTESAVGFSIAQTVIPVYIGERVTDFETGQKRLSQKYMVH